MRVSKIGRPTDRRCAAITFPQDRIIGVNAGVQKPFGRDVKVTVGDHGNNAVLILTRCGDTEFVTTEAKRSDQVRQGDRTRSRLTQRAIACNALNLAQPVGFCSMILALFCYSSSAK